MVLALILVVIGWLLCAFLAGGCFVRDYQSRANSSNAQRDYRTDLGHSVGLSLMGGPLTLFVAICATGFLEHGWGYCPRREKHLPAVRRGGDGGGIKQ